MEDHLTKVGRIEFGPINVTGGATPGICGGTILPRLKPLPHDELGALADEVGRLRQGLWDVYRILGFDTDGQPTPVCITSDIVKLVVDAAQEAREDYDAALKEIPLA